MNGTLRTILLVALALNNPVAGAADDQPIVVGSKNFTESYLLAEIMAQTLEGDGRTVVRRFGFGGTKICFDALVAGEIDVYPEYTGTLHQVIVTGDAGDAALRAGLHKLGVLMLPSFGFNNTYALAMSEERAAGLGIERITDLAAYPELVAGYSLEFLNRPDGWPGLAAVYGLDLDVRGIEHGLAYQALAESEIDLTDAYSTDGELTRYGLRLLTDDRAFFPRYLAVPLVREGLDPNAIVTLERLGGSLDDGSMRR